MNKQELIESSIGWFSDVVEKCRRLTSGNVSHNAANLRGFACRCSEYITKHNTDNDELIAETADTFSYIADKASRLTSGNVTHQSANIICIASIRRNILQLPKNNES